MTNADRPIIVVGCPRSGTTLLQLMLHAHSKIAIPPENRFVLPTYRKREQYGDLHEAANRRRLAKAIVKGKKSRFHDFGLDPKQTIEEIVAAPPTLGSALATVFQSYASRFDKPRWGDKRPMYAMHLDIIHELFPTARFINIVRDGRDCVASLKEMDWYRHDSRFAVSTWALSVDRARQVAQWLGPDSYYELTYEQLVADPDRELRSLCEFIGEDYEPAMTEPAKVAPVAVPERKGHHALTHKPVTDARIGSWRERLEPWEIALCESVLGDRLRQYGYELTEAGRPPVRVRLGYEWTALRRRMALRRSTAAAGVTGRSDNPVAAQLSPSRTESAVAGKTEA